MVAARTSTLTMENIRCFSKEAIVLRPLTILVGENSTGKTTTLGCHQTALSILGDPGENFIFSPFNQEPHEMGKFHNIVRKYKTAKTSKQNGGIILTHSFGQLVCKSWYAEGKDGYSALDKILLSIPGNDEIALELLLKEVPNLKLNKKNGSNKLSVTVEHDLIALNDLNSFLNNSVMPHIIENAEKYISIPVDVAKGVINSMTNALSQIGLCSIPAHKPKSKRFYDYNENQEPEPDDKLPCLLFELRQNERKKFDELVSRINDFGKASNTFEKLAIKINDEQKNEFEITVKRDGKRLNVHDMGTGVWPALAQLLSVEAEILLNGTKQFHLQHLEEYSHPRLHAEFIKWLCKKVDDGFNFIIETHSDYALLRLTIEVCDQSISPEDIAISCFEHKPKEKECKIHNLHLGENGMIVDAPHCYERFYYDETKKYLMASPRPKA